MPASGPSIHATVFSSAASRPRHRHRHGPAAEWEEGEAVGGGEAERAGEESSVFDLIEEDDKVIEKDEGLPPVLLGSCNDHAKQLDASPSGRLLTALICEYLDWAQLNHTLKVYLPECNLQNDSWKAELKDFSNKNGYDLNRNGDSGPFLLDVLEGFLKFEVQAVHYWIYYVAWTRTRTRRLDTATRKSGRLWKMKEAVPMEDEGGAGPMEDEGGAGPMEDEGGAG